MTKAPGPTVRSSECLVAIGTFATGLLVWRSLGGRFIIPFDLWPFLSPSLLLDDLGRSLLDLHAQPPLLNLVLGLALKASVATSTPPEAWLFTIQLVLASAGILALCWVTKRLIGRRWLRWLVLALVLGNPYLYGQVHFFFYTLWEPTLLAIMAAAAVRYHDAPGTRSAVLLFLPAMALVHSRAMYHLLWLIAVATLVMARAWRIPHARRGVLAVSSIAVILSLAWPAKNLARFAFFGSSSWAGYNFWRGLPLERPVALEAFERGPRNLPSRRAIAAVQSVVPQEWRDHPALAEPIRPPDVSPNWNHYAIIPLSRALGTAAVDFATREPWIMGLRALDYYTNGYCIYEGRGWLGEDAFVRDIEPAGEAWPRVFETISLLKFRAPSGNVTEVTTGFTFLFPIILAASAAVLFRRRRSLAWQEWTVALMLFCVAWSFALIVLVDGAEGNRMRFGTGWFTFLLAAWVLEILLDRRVASPGPSPRGAARRNTARIDEAAGRIPG